MRVSRLLRLSSALLALSFLPGTLRAQTIPSAYSFINTKQEYGIFAGYGKHGTGRFGYGPDSGILFGGRYAVELKGPLAFEASATVLSGTRDVMDPARAAGQRKIGESQFRIGNFDAGLRFSLVGDRTWKGWNPFIDFNIGYALALSGDTPTDKRLSEGDRFSFGSSFDGSMGAGTRYFISDRLSLRADLTALFWKLSTPPGFADPNRGFTNVARSEWVSGTRFTVAALLNR